jgi:hypothetical protein
MLNKVILFIMALIVGSSACAMKLNEQQIINRLRVQFNTAILEQDYNKAQRAIQELKNMGAEKAKIENWQQELESLKKQLGERPSINMPGSTDAEKARAEQARKNEEEARKRSEQARQDADKRLAEERALKDAAEKARAAGCDENDRLLKVIAERDAQLKVQAEELNKLKTEQAQAKLSADALNNRVAEAERAAKERYKETQEIRTALADAQRMNASLRAQLENAQAKSKEPLLPTLSPEEANLQKQLVQKEKELKEAIANEQAAREAMAKNKEKIEKEAYAAAEEVGKKLAAEEKVAAALKQKVAELEKELAQANKKASGDASALGQLAAGQKGEQREPLAKGHLKPKGPAGVRAAEIEDLEFQLDVARKQVSTLDDQIKKCKEEREKFLQQLDKRRKLTDDLAQANEEAVKKYTVLNDTYKQIKKVIIKLKEDMDQSKLTTDQARTIVNALYTDLI